MERNNWTESKPEYERQLQMKQQKQLEDLIDEFNILQSEKKKLIESVKAMQEACVKIVEEVEKLSSEIPNIKP
ncbi:hypothetical protein CR513_57315, partial [Mucuna pruriens]